MRVEENKFSETNTMGNNTQKWLARFDAMKLAGLLIILSCIQLVALISIGQALYPNYSWQHNSISSLGVGPTAIFLTLSMEIFGILLVISAFLLYVDKIKIYVPIALCVIGLSAMGFGLFPENNMQPWHGIFAVSSFGSVAISAILLSLVFKGRLRYFSLLSGFVSLFLMYIPSVRARSGISFFGFGGGGLQELLLYNELLWLVVIGAGFVKGWLGRVLLITGTILLIILFGLGWIFHNSAVPTSPAFQTGGPPECDGKSPTDPNLPQSCQRYFNRVKNIQQTH